MVATPSAAYTTTVWQAALAGPETGKELLNMVSESPNSLLRYLVKKEIRTRHEFEKNNSMDAKRANGYTPATLTYGSASGIQRELRVSTMATTGAIAMSSAISTSVDQAMPSNPLRVLTGDYGCVYGYVNYGLEEKIRGSRGKKNIHEWVPIVRKDLCQQLCNQLETQLHSAGGATNIDGLAMWRATTGTKWNSQDLGTDTFLQGLSDSCTLAEFTKAKVRAMIRKAARGGISTNYQAGYKPSLCLITSDLLDIMREWVEDQHSHDVQNSAALEFVELGTPEDYVIFDGVVFMVDNYLDNNIGQNAGILYMLRPQDIELITHEDYGWNAIDPWHDGDAPPQFKEIEQPAYLAKFTMKALILLNMFYKNPRHLLYATVS